MVANTTPTAPSRLLVLTSGGDSSGMNAAVRAVVRSALDAGLDVFAALDGLQGLVDGGERIKPMTSEEVSGILQRGGTSIGTARSDDFRTHEGRRRAVRHLVERGINALVVIGGDGSLSGADQLRAEWEGLVEELVSAGELDAVAGEQHRQLMVVGLVGSIDNDMFGTDMTIGADTALHRITDAVDTIQSTASSHQRTFVIEVMGRNCGYLALMGSLATGANYVLIPENPPTPGWEDEMCEVLAAGRRAGRRASIVIVAEGVRSPDGELITSEQVRQILEDRLGEDARVTILGHVQRGGAPSAFDRYLGTVLGDAAVSTLLEKPSTEARLVGIQGHRIVISPLMESVAKTRSIAEVIADRDVARAMELRGRSFARSFKLFGTMVQARPRRSSPTGRTLRLAVLHAGGPSPGMNTAVRVAVRVGMDHGHRLLGVRSGFKGLAAGEIEELGWMSVSGWVSRPGAELGTHRLVPTGDQLARVAAQVEAHEIDGLMIIGGWNGYSAAQAIVASASEYGALNIPVVCVPASINNDLPATELSIGADTALNSIIADVDKIKESAVASQRCFVVEVMGHNCGYLGLMSAITTGAERVYLPEEGITIAALERDLEILREGFALGKRRGLVIRSEHADPVYTTGFITSLFDHESGGNFDVRGAILGHVQQGGAPSPFDRIQATRFGSSGIRHLIDAVEAGWTGGVMLGLVDGSTTYTPLGDFDRMVDLTKRTVNDPWWLELRRLADTLAVAR